MLSFQQKLQQMKRNSVTMYGGKAGNRDYLFGGGTLNRQTQTLQNSYYKYF